MTDTQERVQHTPGPWEFDTDSNHTFMVWPSDDPDSSTVICRGITTEANAHLIAEAPRLLEALRPFADQTVVEDALCHRGITTPARCCRCGPILAARAAIAKAEGRV
jgi:hypothetical protein